MENLSFIRFDPAVHLPLIGELTELLHEAYASLAQQGLFYLAYDQSEEVTLRRLNEGESYLAFLDSRLIGTISLCKPHPESGASWYRKPGVYSFRQFAVSPRIQGQGIGSRFLEFIESRAKELDAEELALDTSEKATQLIDTYSKRGWKWVENVQWPTRTYRSVIMSKSLRT